MTVQDFRAAEKCGKKTESAEQSGKRLVCRNKDDDGTGTKDS